MISDERTHSRLAELLTRAERLAEREVAEAMTGILATDEESLTEGYGPICCAACLFRYLGFLGNGDKLMTASSSDKQGRARRWTT